MRATSGDRPSLSVGCLAVSAGGLLMLQETGEYAEAEWRVPGGPLPWGVPPEEAVERYALDQAGVTVKAVRGVAYTNDLALERGYHEVTLFVLCEHVSGEPTVRNPELYQRAAWLLTSGVNSRCRNLSLSLHNLTSGNTSFFRKLG